MKQSELAEALKSPDNLERFLRSISAEVERYRDQLKKVGGVTDIYLSNGNARLVIQDSEIRTLCDSFLRGGISTDELAYVCDGILLGERIDFGSDHHRELIEEMTDPEVNGRFTVQRANQIVGSLAGS